MLVRIDCGVMKLMSLTQEYIHIAEDDEEVEAWQEEEEEEEDMDRPMVDMQLEDQDQDQEDVAFCAPCGPSDPAGQAAALHALLEEHGDDSSLFPPLDGTSFYTNICLMNHACSPNVLVEYVSLPEGAGAGVGGLFEGAVEEFRGNLRKGLCAQVLHHL